MKIAVKGTIISSEQTRKGGHVFALLSEKHPQTGSQEVFKVYSKEPVKIGAELKGTLTGHVDLWFLE